MSPDTVGTILKQGGIALLALVVLGYIVKKIGERMIGAIDRVTARSDENAKELSENLTLATTTLTDSITRSSAATVMALGHLTERLSRMEGKVEVLSSRGRSDQDFDEPTPVGGGPYIEPVTRQTPPPRTAYGPIRPATDKGKIR